MDLTLTSSAFESGGTIPTRYTCERENISPPLSWQAVPHDTRSLVLICDDPDAPRGPWSHWVLYNIPASLDGLPEGVTSGERPAEFGIQGRNDFGNIKYEGPCPPVGTTHDYYFRLYALDEMLDLSPGATRAQVIDRLQDHIITQTEMIGRYGIG